MTYCITKAALLALQRRAFIQVGLKCLPFSPLLDLLIYFSEGDSSYSIAWLSLNNRTAADAQFQLAFLHMDLAHFNIWTEKTAELSYGHLNFITGAGGYLQNFLFGYAGLTPLYDSDLEVYYLQ